MTITELYGALAARGLIAESQEPPAGAGPAANTSPWYVQLLTGVCAWIASLFLWGFIIAAFSSAGFREESLWNTLIALGVFACVAAALVYRVSKPESAFAGQFALALSFTGQLGIGVGVGATEGATAAFWCMLLVEVGLIFAMSNRPHRFVSSLAAVVMWALAMRQILYPGRGSFLENPELPPGPITVLLWMVVWMPVVAAAWWLVRREASWMADGRDRVWRPVVQGLLASLAIAPLVTHPSGFWFALGVGRDVQGTISNWVSLWPLLAAVLDLVALGLAFALRNRALMGLAIIFALLEIGSFYYVLGTTLLIKSFIMLTIGVGLALAGRQLGRASS